MSCCWDTILGISLSLQSVTFFSSLELQFDEPLQRHGFSSRSVINQSLFMGWVIVFKRMPANGTGLETHSMATRMEVSILLGDGVRQKHNLMYRHRRVWASLEVVGRRAKDVHAF